MGRSGCFGCVWAGLGILGGSGPVWAFWVGLWAGLSVLVETLSRSGRFGWTSGPVWAFWVGLWACLGVLGGPGPVWAFWVGLWACLGVLGGTGPV